MKKFLKYLVGVVAFTIAAAFALDASYTFAYYHSKPRNKFQYLIKMKPRHYDDVFLGSSRTANHFDSALFTRLTGESAINLGMDGAILEDSFLELQLLLDKKATVSRVYLQVDYLFEKEGVSFIANSNALPYLRKPVVREHLRPLLPNFNACYYLPFYRYMTFDFATGIREVMLGALGKGNKINLEDGFTPKEGKGGFAPFSLPKSIRNRNATIEKFRKVCAENNIDLVLFIAPVCSATENLDYVGKLKTRLPDLRDYSRAFPDSLFFNCNHLTRDGAEKFTALVANDLLKERGTLKRK